MPVNEYLPKVLISHSWKDKKETMIIADGLREINCAHIWIDFERMYAGVDINTEIYNQIQKSDFLVLVWTFNAMASENVLQEIQWAMEFNIPIIPCYFQFEENGEVSPHLGEKLREITGKNLLWVEFRNNNGIVELYSSIYAKQSQLLPEEVVQQFSEKHEVLKRMEGYNKYLTNYRNVKDRNSSRKPWINRIMKEIEGLANSGLNKELVDNFMSALYKLETSDPEAFELLKPGLDAYFSNSKNPAAHQVPPLHQFQIPASVVNPFVSPVLERLRKNFRDMLERENMNGASSKSLEKDWPQSSLEQRMECILGIINISADGIYLLDQAYLLARQSGLENEFSPILEYVTAYYFEVEDFRSDELGALGWVDDTYLCFSALQQINHLYYSIFQRLLINYDLNPYLQFLLPLMTREEIQQLDTSLTTKFSAINWNDLLIQLANLAINNIDFGYQQVNASPSQNRSWGGTWEDEMAQRAARLGISWNF